MELKWKVLNAALFNHNLANGVNVMNADPTRVHLL